ncbi:MAG: efflux RND transporter periplasmic adaptor subunit [Candidatus Binatia bacterium]
MKKVLGVLIVVILIGLLGWQVFRRASTSLKGSPRRHRAVAVAVEVAPVKRATIRDVKFFAGSLLSKSYFVVAPKIAGRLEKLLVNIGDPVKRGQLIAVLDDEEYAQQVEQARAEMEVAIANVEESRSALDVSQREFERAQALRQKKIASESELDAAQAQYKAQNAKYKVALALVAQRKAALKAAQVRLSYTRIRGSWEDGYELRIVGERFVDEGAMLKANAPIVSILEIHSLRAVIHVIERDYSKVRVGQEAVVTTDAFPGRTFTGKIVRVAPLLKETSRQARVEIEVPNRDQLLKPGMFIRAQIEFARHNDVTVVPLSALAKRGDQQGVFLADNETMKARFVPVTLGIVDGKMAEVVKPSLSGSVVTLGHHLLEDGSPITLPDTKQMDSSPKRVKPDAPKKDRRSRSRQKR